MRTAPYGSWTSPIAAAGVAAGEKQVEYLDCVGDEIWWVENRPEENGRSALVRRAADGTIADALDARWNVRSRVIEYGGRPWASLGGGAFAFTHWDDQRVYRADPDGTVRPLSPEPARPAGDHYADFTVVGGHLWGVRESMTGPAPTDVRRDLVALPLDGSAADDPGQVRVLAATHHFMTGPKVSPDGKHAVWLGWDHPSMPWERTDVMCAPVVGETELGEPRLVAGGGDTAVSQVEWAPDRPDTLYLLSDRDGWWNLYELTVDGPTRPLCPRAEEFGEPLWRLGARWFLPIGGGRLFVVHGTGGGTLAVLEPDGSLRDFGGPYTEWSWPATDGRRVAALAGAPRLRRTIVIADPDGGVEPIRPAPVPNADYLPTGVKRTFTGPDGEDVHAYVYPPHNPDFTAPDGELPPFVVHVHGGPTNRGQLVVNQEFAYFTSRGIGVVDVQYGGSTGFGRAYRERLNGNWGVVDVRDCATAIRALIAEGAADPARTAIRGGSAGGWTAAASLAAEPDLYRAGSIYFPVLDPVSWRVAGTHDFESRYLESLIGPWPEAKARYAEVSPLARADAIRAPFVLLQGLDDAVCPPEQAELLLGKLRGRGVPHAYLAFEGEQHGFRKVETITACLTAELALYARVFGFTAPDVPAIDLTS
ncbi:prolyl oligopeptidase family serine peptidase [Actinokineospora sp. NPDC004072]